MSAAVDPAPTAPGGRVRTQAVVVLAVACVAGVVLIATRSLAQASTVAGALAVATAVIAVYGALLALVIRGLDRWRTLRLGPVLAAAAWGGLVAGPLAGIANGRMFVVFDAVFGVRAAAPLGPLVSAPLVEESLKVLGVLVALVIAGRRPSGPLEAMMLGAVAGLGFQLSENLDYLHDGALWNPDSDATGVLSILVQRIPSGINGHWTYTALAGLTVGLLLARPRRTGFRRALAVLPLLAAVALHVLNNVLGVLGAGGPGILVDLAVGLLVLTLVYRVVARDQWRRAAEVLRSEPDPVCDDAEADALRTRRTARAARRGARRDGGRPAARERGYRQRAQIALATATLQGRPTDAARRALLADSERPVPAVTADG